MKESFVETQPYRQMKSLIEDLMRSAVGVEMAAVVGRAGRGKTTSAQRIVAQDSRTVYLRFEEWMSSPVGLIREVAFRLAGLRPHATQACVRLIKEELGRDRRIILVDEADRLNLRHLNALRDIHDVCSCPVVLIGEEPLKANLGRESRLISRTRTTVEFGPAGQADLVVYYKQALGLDVPRDLAPVLLKHSGGDFRRIVNDALALERLLKSNGSGPNPPITEALVNAVCTQ